MAAVMSFLSRSVKRPRAWAAWALCSAVFAAADVARADEHSEPVYSWIEIAIGAEDLDPGREPDEVLERRRVLEARLQRAESKGNRRRTAILSGRTAPLLVTASNQLWMEQLQAIDASEDFVAAFETLDTTDADALRDEALRRYERALEAVDSGDVSGLKRRANSWRLDAARIRREREETDTARAMLATVLEGPARRSDRRAAAMELGELQFTDGDVKAALSAYQVAARLGGEGDRGPYARYRIGWCQLRLGDPRSAADSLLRASRDAEDRSLARQARSDALQVATRLEVDDALSVVDAACTSEVECLDRERAELADRMDASGRPDAAAAVRSLR